jgi:hypothetical protein
VEDQLSSTKDSLHAAKVQLGLDDESGQLPGQLQQQASLDAVPSGQGDAA